MRASDGSGYEGRSAASTDRPVSVLPAGEAGVRAAPGTLRALKWSMTAIAAAVLAACGGGDESTDARGGVASTTQTMSYAKAAIDSIAAPLAPLIGAAAKCDVTQHKVVYDTIDPRGGAARASAGLAIPSGCPGPYPVLVYTHGTTVTKSFSMSSPANAEAALQVAMFAAQGYVVVMPDYHGYGDSNVGYHPYLHAENTAAVSVDALRASRKVLADRGVATSGKLFISGYSQGGHSAMALLRTLERDHANEFKVTASTPSSGPYALEETFVGGLTTPSQGATVFATMTFVGYQKAYGDVYAKPEDVFRAPWVTGIESLLPGTLGFDELFTTGKLPLQLTGAGGLLTDGFVAGVQSSADFPMRRRLRENGLLNWKPAAPMTLCTGSRDPVVPAANTTAAGSYFGSRGAVVNTVDVETVPSFAPAIAAQLANDPYLLTYHGTVVPPLCAAVAKGTFDALK
ncbi:MAG: hypothetical protein RIS35_1829 [Pseudomonadota bacterium]